MRHSGQVYGQSKGRRPGSKLFYKRVWSAGNWDEFLLRHMGDEQLMLQVCCGASKIGKVRVDVQPDVPGVNVLADMLRLPFANRSFDVVACDPPYELDYKTRVKLQRELVRVSKRRVIFKAPWIPRATGWKLGETVLVASHTCANVSVMSVLDRSAENGKLFV